MTESSRGGRILARWTVDAGDLRDFVREQRIRAKDSYMPDGLLKECDAASQGAGLEVVCREDAILVGSCRLTNMFDDIRVHDTWMHFLGDEGYQIAVPIPRGGRREAERVAATYRARFEQLNAQAAREHAEERAKPTLNNRLLNIAEAHFVWVLLGFFFVLIPLLPVVLDVLFGST
jgi:hypothetical protein